MAFGQPSGPPATARQLRDLLALVEGAGHSDFRDARGPLGLTQRQAGGRFTQDEAATLIAQLEVEAEAEAEQREGSDGGVGEPEGTAPKAARPPSEAQLDRAARAASPPRSSRVPPAATAARSSNLAEQLQRVPEELLVDELRRRGWALIPPSLAT